MRVMPRRRKLHRYAARVCDEFVSTLDFLPTFARLAGAENLPPALDGFDMGPVLFGEKGARSRRATLYSLYGLNQRRLESMREGR